MWHCRKAIIAAVPRQIGWSTLWPPWDRSTRGRGTVGKGTDVIHHLAAVVEVAEDALLVNCQFGLHSHGHFIGHFCGNLILKQIYYQPLALQTQSTRQSWNLRIWVSYGAKSSWANLSIFHAQPSGWSNCSRLSVWTTSVTTLHRLNEFIPNKISEVWRNFV